MPIPGLNLRASLLIWPPPMPGIKPMPTSNCAYSPPPSTRSPARFIFKWISAANSATIIDLAHGHFNMVRPGHHPLRSGPFQGNAPRLNLMPVMQFKTRVVYIKKCLPGHQVGYGSTHTTSRTTVLATLPVGYADGYSRHLSNRASVLIAGRRCPVVGRVCMDQIVVDLGPGARRRSATRPFYSAVRAMPRFR